MVVMEILFVVALLVTCIALFGAVALMMGLGVFPDEPHASDTVLRVDGLEHVDPVGAAMLRAELEHLRASNVVTMDKGAR